MGRAGERPEIPGDARACWSAASTGLENIPDRILIPKDNYILKHLYRPHTETPIQVSQYIHLSMGAYD